MRKETALIIPTFNQKEMTEKNILLLKNQTYQDFDIIVIDNNSTDGTSSYLERKYPNIKLIKNEENFGGAGAQNIGCKFAYKEGYKIIILSDNDAFPTSDKLLEKLSYKIRSKKEIGAVLPSGEENKDKLKAFHYFTIKRETIDKIGFPNFNFFLLYDDVTYYQRILKHFSIAHLDKPYYTHKNKENNFLNRFYLYYDTRNALRAFSFFPRTFYKEMLGRVLRACSLSAYSVITKDKELETIIKDSINDAYTFEKGRKDLVKGKIFLERVKNKGKYTKSSAKMTLFWPVKEYTFLDEDSKELFKMKNSKIKFFIFIEKIFSLGIPVIIKIIKNTLIIHIKNKKIIQE